MAEENKSSDPKDVLKILLAVFVFGFIVWYATGGPQRWDERVKKNGFHKSDIIGTVDFVK
ncbi:hypothetical protein CSB11_01705 [Candidatus Campbellbacteria bacterium]|nr:MAG: hypothetical protein CSB11_01705 [Candidatus Campbellbacteria bacterium]